MGRVMALVGAACVAASAYAQGDLSESGDGMPALRPEPEAERPMLSPDFLAERIRQSVGVRRGLCVHVGVGDGRLTAALAEGGGFVVHGIAADQTSLDRARAHLQTRGLSERAAVERGALAPLPYADELANLVVVDDLAAALKAGLTVAEVRRILAPNGVAWIGAAKGLSVEALKAALADVPAADVSIIEEGGVLAHGGKNGCQVSGAGRRESEVRLLQPETRNPKPETPSTESPSGPEVLPGRGLPGVWARLTKPRPPGYGDWTHYYYDPGHNRVSSDTVVGPPQRLRWIAGKPWPSNDYKGYGMVLAGGRVFYAYDETPYRKAAPWPFLTARDAYSGVLLWRRPAVGFSAPAAIATPERLYTRDGPAGLLVALDAATGEVQKTYEACGGSVAWAVLYQGRLIMSAGGWLRCLDAETGKSLWVSDTWKVNRQPDVAVDGDRIYVKEFGRHLLGCLTLADGREVWSVDYTERLSAPGLTSGMTAYHDGVVVIGEAVTGRGVHAFSAQDGRHLWSLTYDLLGTPSRRKAKSYLDGLFLGGLFWAHVGEVTGEGLQRYKGRDFYWLGVDPQTGKEVKRHHYPEGVGGGASCYPDLATVRYFMGGYTDFLDTTTGEYHPRAMGLRATCAVGSRPANGLVYACILYQPRRYLQGDVAMTGGSPPEPGELPLERGPADPPADAPVPGHDDWPCYRHDPGRTGRSQTAVPAQLRPAWQAPVAPAPPPDEAVPRPWAGAPYRRLSPPTAAGGLVYVAAVDAHQVVALDAATGAERWRFTAGGRVPLPPTIHAGLCLFGANDGWVYALKADTGQLVWRLRAARSDRRIVAHEQVESPWPVAQGVLVVDGLAYAAAGRHGDVDGGLDLLAVEPRTGRLVWRKPAPALTATLLLSDGRAVSVMENATRFALATGEKASRPDFPAGAYYADTLLPAHIIGTREGEEAAFPHITGAPVAVIRAGDLVVAAGRPQPPDGPLQLRWAAEPQTIRDLPEEAPERARPAEGHEVWVFKASGGAALLRLPLPAAPVFDGLAAADGRLYLSTADGFLRCFAGPP